MKKVVIILFTLSVCFAACNLKSGDRDNKEIRLDDKWKFSTGDDRAWADPQFDDNNWVAILASRLWEDQGYPDYDGYGWYRQQVMIPGNWEEGIKRYGGLVVKYDNADDVDELFFNNNSVGTTGSFPP